MNRDFSSSSQIDSFFENKKRILVTGGAGFIGGCLIRRLLSNPNLHVFNLDKCGYASDLSSIYSHQAKGRHRLLNVDLFNTEETNAALNEADPDIVFHLAAESHVDRSIDNPRNFIESNITGTFNLLEAIRNFWDNLPENRKDSFRILHISTDEVFGSLEDSGSFNENTPYNPSSPYAASKAASDHIVRAWNCTYGIPSIITNCSNNFGPWQFPEKLIPLVILKALSNQEIPLYGDGKNIRDWLFVEDHIDALLIAVSKGDIGQSYCVGGNGERKNEDVVNSICSLLDVKAPRDQSYASLIKLVNDRPAHDYRYAINSRKISNKLGWQPKHSFDSALSLTVDWYLNHLDWCKDISKKSDYFGGRIGLMQSS